MFRTFIKNNMNVSAILVFMILFTLIILCKPGFIYNKDGSFRQFGLAYKNKTVIPIWLVSLLLGIISYLIVMFYSYSNKIEF